MSFYIIIVSYVMGVIDRQFIPVLVLDVIKLYLLIISGKHCSLVETVTEA